MVADRQPLKNFLAELLAEQGQLQTPVARFAALREFSPSALRPFRPSLIPLSKPGPGEQYAFEVDLDSCSGCKACVVACHALNGLDDTESWRDVGLVHGGTFAAPYQQTITTACHHCADPACLNGCPVLAYEKDPVTGIVRHLDDQCIGCQYCVLKCPYDVPKYSERLGIVRKCDLCHQRLGAGEAPACVQACPTEAITIVKVSITVGGSPSPRVDTSAFLPVAPDPAYTQPTTRYVSARPLPENLVAADAAALRPQPPHWPLVIMLTLLPVAVGVQSTAAFLVFNHPAVVIYYLTIAGWLSGTAGLAASVFHLGQPLRAWRIFLGWRTSWLSREAIGFGAWFGLATTTTLSAAGYLLLPLRPLLGATALVGLAGLSCSVMIYVDTRRHFWRLGQTAPRFFGTALTTGLAAALAFSGSAVTAAALIISMLLKLAGEVRVLRPLDHHDVDAPPPFSASKTALLISGPLRRVFCVRGLLGLAGGVLLPFTVVTRSAPLSAAWWGLALVVGGEFAERYLFFRAVDAPKMPGWPRP